MLHLNNEVLKKTLFKWLHETLGTLKKEDERLKSEEAAKLRQRAEMVFDSTKTTAEALINESSDEED